MAGTSYRQLRVGQYLIGMVGLDELFSELSSSGWPAEPGLIADLLAGARRANYIPTGAQTLYGEALLRAYAGYRQEEVSGKTAPRPGRTWRGIPREQIPWYPTLYADSCDGCGRCLSFCPNGVYEPTADSSKVEVSAPLNCEVGCSACVSVCPQEAITFPPRTVLETLH